MGGIFFDDLTANAETTPHYVSLIKALSSAFSAAYFPLVLAHHSRSFTPAQYNFQQMRRSRYVEFNLMLDKGHTATRTSSFMLQRCLSLTEARGPLPACRAALVGA